MHCKKKKKNKKNSREDLRGERKGIKGLKNTSGGKKKEEEITAWERSDKNGEEKLQKGIWMRKYEIYWVTRWEEMMWQKLMSVIG